MSEWSSVSLGVVADDERITSYNIAELIMLFRKFSSAVSVKIFCIFA
jgi:hypothetical protein